MIRFGNLSRNATIRVLSFAVAAVIVLAGFCYKGWHQASVYRRRIEYDYQKSFQDLVDNVVAIDTALQKGGYVKSPTLIASLAGEISRKAYGAQASLSALPYAFAELESTAGFLSQVGDYSYYLSKQAALGKPPDDEQTEEIRRLSEISSYLSHNLSQLLSVAQEENLNIGRLLAQNKIGGELSDLGGFAQTVSETESRFSELPMLIYDGPFSDHIEKRESLFLRGKPELDRNAAASRAAEHLDIQPALLQPVGEISGKIPAYQFKTVIDGGEIAVAITKQGGYCLSLTNSRIIGDPKLSFEAAVKKAQEHLTAQGFDGMKESYYTRVGNMLLVNFAYKFNDVVYYPDLIKVGIALDTGKVCVFEATGFLMNHTYRDLPEPLITVNEALSSLSDGLFVSSAEVCIVPSDGLNEVLCYGFTCVDAESRTYLVYVNAQTGLEERILLLLEDENGSLTV